MRGLAALLVVVFHAYLVWSWLGPGDGAPSWLSWGWVGVDFFFVLSGFLLSLPLLANPAAVKDVLFWRTYLLKRWLRIAPPYYASLGVSLVVLDRLPYMASGMGRGDVVAHLLYIHNFYHPFFGSINSVYWTLAIEFQFYLILPLLVLLFVGRRWWVSIIALVATSIAWRAAVYDPADASWLTLQLPAFLGHFALGIGAARLYRQGWRPTLPASLVAAGALLGLVVVPMRLLTHGALFLQGTETPMANLVLRPLVALGFATFVLTVAGPGAAFRRILTSWPARHIGIRSYSLYLVHLPIMGALLPYGAHFGFAAYAALMVAASLAASVVFFQMIERPFLQLKARIRAPNPGALTAPKATYPLLPGAATPQGSV